MLWILLGFAFAGELHGTVRDTDGEPIEDAYIGVYDTFLEVVATVGPTGADGAWTVQVDDGEYRVRVVPGMGVNRVEGWSPTGGVEACDGDVYSVLDDHETPAADVVLSPGGVVRGVVLGADGEPAADIEVIASMADGGSPTQRRQAISDADGRYSINGLLPEVPWILQLEAEGVPNQVVPGVYGVLTAQRFLPEAGELLSATDTLLRPGVSISGVVRGPDGPVPDVFVFTYSGGQAEVERTDAQGRYTALGMPPGPAIAWVSTDGYAKTYHPNSVTPETWVDVPNDGDSTDVMHITMPLESRIVATLQGDGDMRSAGAIAYTPDQSVGIGMPSDEDGLVTIGRLHAGPYNLYLAVEQAGYLPGMWLDDDGNNAVIDLPSEGDAAVSVPLVPAARIDGNVTDPDGRAVAYADVVAVSVSTDERFETFTNTLGDYSIVGLPDDRYDVFAELLPPCEADAARVRMYLGDTPDPDARRSVDLTGGQSLGWNAVLPDDADRDGMDDRWERSVGLDPTVDDSRDDPDGDTAPNLIEYWDGTDPFDSPGCGCQGAPAHSAWWLVLLALGVVRRRGLCLTVGSW